MTISLLAVVLWVLAFCIVYAMITTLIERQPYRKIAYGVLLFLALLVVLSMLGVFGSHPVIVR